MNREVLHGAIIIVLLLSLGALIGERFKPLSSAKLESNPFRAWFWEQRTFDLLAQVGLIFAGALGVAAILPQAGDAGRLEGIAPTETISDIKIDG